MHSVTDRQTDGQTDGQHDYANSRLYCVAVRSAKNRLATGLHYPNLYPIWAYLFTEVEFKYLWWCIYIEQ